MHARRMHGEERTHARTPAQSQAHTHHTPHLQHARLWSHVCLTLTKAWQHGEAKLAVRAHVLKAVGAPEGSHEQPLTADPHQSDVRVRQEVSVVVGDTAVLCVCVCVC